MEEQEYRKKLLTYSVMIVVASVFGSGTPVLAFTRWPTAITITLGLIAIVLFIYATVWFGSYLRLTSVQWLAAILLALLAWAGSAIYLVTRKPNRAEE